MQIAERRLAAFRILGEVDAVWLVLDVLVATEEDRVEECRAELAHTTAHVCGTVTAVDLAVDDRSITHVAFRLGALANLLVDRERLARPHDRIVDGTGHGLDVRDSRFPGCVSRREARNQSERPPRFDLFGGDPWFDVGHDGEIATASVERSVVQRFGQGVDVDASAVLRECDRGPTRSDIRVYLHFNGRLFEFGEARFERRGDDVGIQTDFDVGGRSGHDVDRHGRSQLRTEDDERLIGLFAVECDGTVDEAFDGGGGIVELFSRQNRYAVDQRNLSGLFHPVEHGRLDDDAGGIPVDSHPGIGVRDDDSSIDDRDVSVEGRLGDRRQFPQLDIVIDGSTIDGDFDRYVEFR